MLEPPRLARRPDLRGPFLYLRVSAVVSVLPRVLSPADRTSSAPGPRSSGPQVGAQGGPAPSAPHGAQPRTLPPQPHSRRQLPELPTSPSCLPRSDAQRLPRSQKSRFPREGGAEEIPPVGAETPGRPRAGCSRRCFTRSRAGAPGSSAALPPRVPSRARRPLRRGPAPPGSRPQHPPGGSCPARRCLESRFARGCSRAPPGRRSPAFKRLRSGEKPRRSPGPPAPTPKARPGPPGGHRRPPPPGPALFGATPGSAPPPRTGPPR